MGELTQDEIKRRCEAYPRLIEALMLTTTALERSQTPGARQRISESQRLLDELEPKKAPEKSAITKLNVPIGEQLAGDKHGGDERDL